MKKWIKVLAVVMLAVALPFVCGAESGNEQAVRVAALKGPTGMAVSHMMAENDGTYAFTLAGAPEEVNAMIISGQVDIAAVPINAGSVLYNKTEGGVRLGLDPGASHRRMDHRRTRHPVRRIQHLRRVRR